MRRRSSSWTVTRRCSSRRTRPSLARRSGSRARARGSARARAPRDHRALRCSASSYCLRSVRSRAILTNPVTSPLASSNGDTVPVTIEQRPVLPAVPAFVRRRAALARGLQLAAQARRPCGPRSVNIERDVLADRFLFACSRTRAPRRPSSRRGSRSLIDGQDEVFLDAVDHQPQPVVAAGARPLPPAGSR